jgi:hypothetical protein
MSTKYQRAVEQQNSKNHERTLKCPLFPLGIECVVTAKWARPLTTGTFHKLKNSELIVFVYEDGIRIADLDYRNEPFDVRIKHSEEKWDFYY